MDSLKRRIRDFILRLRFSLDSPPIARDYTNHPLEESTSPLPTELLLQIFVQISVEDLLRCRRVCRAFQAVIDGSPETQYYIELHVSGYKNNNANTTMGAEARLEALQAQQRWWKAPSESVQNPEDFGWASNNSHSQFYDNVWIRCTPTWRCGAAPGYNAIQCICFEQAADGRLLADTWKYSFPYIFEAVAADPSRDRLYGLVMNDGDPRGYRLLTMAMSDGAVLSEQVLEPDALGDHIQVPITMHFEEEIIAVVTESIRASAVRVTLLDHQSGVAIASISRGTRVHSWGDSEHIKLQLITKSCFLLHVMDYGNIITEVYVVAPAAATQPLNIQLVATFEYPTVHIDFDDNKSTCNYYNRSFTVEKSRCGGLMTRNAPPRPFVRSHGSKILFIRRIYGYSSILHCVQLSVFMSAVENSRSSHLLKRAPVHPWKSWGPRNTRCFLDSVSGCHWSYGHQMICRDNTLLDFSSSDIARDLRNAANKGHASTEARQPTLRKGKSFQLWQGPEEHESIQDLDDVVIPGYSGRIVRRATVLRQEMLFFHDIITTLPYRETKIPEDLDGKSRKAHLPFMKVV
ncbi:hypothetical protein BC835DRAFT_1415350 [Cytidiella melzeri]|nr:hypothetical protein BC835DRAFT_1415350 [Cytidiella melzeri]